MRRNAHNNGKGRNFTGRLIDSERPMDHSETWGILVRLRVKENTHYTEDTLTFGQLLIEVVANHLFDVLFRELSLGIGQIHLGNPVYRASLLEQTDGNIHILLQLRAGGHALQTVQNNGVYGIRMNVPRRVTLDTEVFPVALCMRSVSRFTGVNSLIA